MSNIILKAQISNLSIAENQNTQFVWSASVTYSTNQNTPIYTKWQFPEKPANGLSNGGEIPDGKMFFTCNGLSENVGGSLIATVTANENKALRSDIVIRGLNPTKSQINSEIGIEATNSTEATWLGKIACHESSQRQFNSKVTQNKFNKIGEPIMNLIGDGGMGIMQITNNNRNKLSDLVRTHVLWDWISNIDIGVQIFHDKVNLVKSFPSQMQEKASTIGLVQLNAYRSIMNLSPLASVIVNDYPTSDYYVEDAIRANNGWGKGTGLFGLRKHEFWLKNIQISPMTYTINSTITSRVFVNGRWKSNSTTSSVSTTFSSVLDVAISPDGTQGVTTWERYPVSLRVRPGDPNYVENIRNIDPNTCN
jgi:hypothetical protein